MLLTAGQLHYTFMNSSVILLGVVNYRPLDLKGHILELATLLNSDLLISVT